MAVQALLYSRDPQCVEVFSEAASALGIELLEIEDPQRFADLASGQPFDLLIVDCAKAEDWNLLLPKLRRSAANRDAVVIAVSEQQNAKHLLEYGASMPVCKPLSLEAVRRHLRAVLPAIAREQRRYNRYAVKMKVLLSRDAPKSMEALAVNLSEGGILLQLRERIDPAPKETLSLSFSLPWTSEMLELQGHLAWISSDLRAGIRFLPGAKDSLAKIASWLKAYAVQSEASAKIEAITEPPPSRRDD